MVILNALAYTLDGSPQERNTFERVRLYVASREMLFLAVLNWTEMLVWAVQWAMCSLRRMVGQQDEGNMVLRTIEVRKYEHGVRIFLRLSELLLIRRYQINP